MLFMYQRCVRQIDGFPICEFIGDFFVIVQAVEALVTWLMHFNLLLLILATIQSFYYAQFTTHGFRVLNLCKYFSKKFKEVYLTASLVAS